MPCNVQNGAKRTNLVTLQRWSIASRQAHLFYVCSFGSALKYSLFAIVFATRPAIFGLDPSRTSSDIPGFVFQKHPLGSNILPFLVWPKFTVIHKVANRSSSSIWGWRCNQRVLKASRPTSKRRRDHNSSSWLRCTILGLVLLLLSGHSSEESLGQLDFRSRRGCCAQRQAGKQPASPARRNAPSSLPSRPASRPSPRAACVFWNPRGSRSPAATRHRRRGARSTPRSSTRGRGRSPRAS